MKVCLRWQESLHFRSEMMENGVKCLKLVQAGIFFEFLKISCFCRMNSFLLNIFTDTVNLFDSLCVISINPEH